MSGRYTPPKKRLVVTSDVPDDAPAAVKEGLARRRLVATTGRCPCGAQMRIPDRIVPGSVTIVAVEHEPDCPACEPVLAAAVARWER